MIFVTLICIAALTIFLEGFCIYLLVFDSGIETTQVMRVVEILFIAMVAGFILFSMYGWQHDTQNITISDKYILKDQMIVISTDDVSYIVVNKVDYSNLKIGKTYSLNLGHFRDSEPLAMDFVNQDSIDRINFEVDGEL
jgi:hypothetical protein